MKPGRRFEEAVWTFVKSLDTNAQVYFDHKVPDKDTGTLRQCDVWVETTFGGHFRYSILISCKDHTKKLDIGDIETFLGEKSSTGADMGVICSQSGFTGPALKKAEANRVKCCRLYDNQPADLPNSIVVDQYACLPRLRLGFVRKEGFDHINTWNELFDLRTSTEAGSVSTLEHVVDTFMNIQSEETEKFNRSRVLPTSSAFEITWTDTYSDSSICVSTCIEWDIFIASQEATLLNGSYCLENGSFIGQIIGPTIDMHGSHPGDHWKRVDAKAIRLPDNMVVWLLSNDRDRITELIRRQFSSVSLFARSPDAEI